MVATRSSYSWAGRRVLITGHTGFKGSWLALWLSQLGATLRGFALQPPSNPSLFEQAGVQAHVDSTIGDVRDRHHLATVVSEFKPEVVFHLAAQSLVRPSYEDPVGTFATNVMGTVHLLDALRHLGRRCVVISVTSDKCYENRDGTWAYRENDALGGKDPYSASKACQELVGRAFDSSFFQHGDHIRFASVRAGNVIGGGDWAVDRLLPDCFRALAEGETVLLRNPDSVRPWQHVLEPLRGYLTLAETLANSTHYRGAWNFGPDVCDSRTVRWVTERILAEWDGASSWTLAHGPHPPEARTLLLDCTKAKAELGWKPLLGLEEGLEWTISWYRRTHAGHDPAHVTLEQISLYRQALDGLPRS